MSFDGNKTGAFQAVKRSPWPEICNTDAGMAYSKRFPAKKAVVVVFACFIAFGGVLAWIFRVLR